MVKDIATKTLVAVPCGKCPDCKKRLVSAWSFRLMQQNKIAMSSHFITLTYDTKYVPITPTGYMCLSKRDCQLFIKRLRKSQSGNGESFIKYFLVGEYGGKTMRPHYHVLLFNVEVRYIQSAWGCGQVHYGSVSGASVGYCLKYMMKPGKIPIHKNDDRQREFRMMSKKLGVNYLTSQMVSWHKADLGNRMYIPIEDGKKIAMPRYFKDRIYTNLERQFAAGVTAEKINKQVGKVYIEMFEKFGADAVKIKKEQIATAYRRMYADSTKNRKL